MSTRTILEARRPPATDLARELQALHLHLGYSIRSLARVYRLHRATVTRLVSSPKCTRPGAPRR
jgi:hypothetical protein